MELSLTHGLHWFVFWGILVRSCKNPRENTKKQTKSQRGSMSGWDIVVFLFFFLFFSCVQYRLRFHKLIHVWSGHPGYFVARIQGRPAYSGSTDLAKSLWPPWYRCVAPPSLQPACQRWANFTKLSFFLGETHVFRGFHKFDISWAYSNCGFESQMSMVKGGW